MKYERFGAKRTQEILLRKTLSFSINFPGVRNCQLAALLFCLLNPGLGAAQQPCVAKSSVEGIVSDPTGALIAGAQVEIDDGNRATTDSAGHYVLSCVPETSRLLTVQAAGFASNTVSIPGSPNGVAHLNIQLNLAHVETDVQVSGDDTTAMGTDHGAGTRTLTRQDVQQLADDPDDFLRELQALTASGGGMPGSAIITVDGFQSPSALPPKSSIASIRINPDMFSGQYERPPYLGGRIEILTKPGADPFHGALFFTDSDGAFNATDPLSVTATPAGKRRYGFELSGPVFPGKVDFALALEKRDINEFNVVRAVTLDADGNQTPLQETVPAPQRLWIGSARGDWQISPKDVATLSLAANVNNLGNQGVGGLTLPEAGYSNLVSEYDLRFNNVLTLNPNMLHETRIGYTWKRTEQSPLSTAPGLQVAGYFTGGGSTGQNLNDRERDLEVDDDLMVTQGKHTWKIGAQSLGIFVHNYDPNTFNGLISLAEEVRRCSMPRTIRLARQPRLVELNNTGVLCSVFPVDRLPPTNLLPARLLFPLLSGAWRYMVRTRLNLHLGSLLSLHFATSSKPLPAASPTSHREPAWRGPRTKSLRGSSICALESSTTQIRRATRRKSTG
jgi:Carboxypeptidase regulatory-like domain